MFRSHVWTLLGLNECISWVIRSIFRTYFVEKALISCFCLTNFPIVVEEKGANNNNWAWTTQADKASDMAQELSHVHTLFLFMQLSYCIFIVFIDLYFPLKCDLSLWEKRNARRVMKSVWREGWSLNLTWTTSTLKATTNLKFTTHLLSFIRRY